MIGNEGIVGITSLIPCSIAADVLANDAEAADTSIDGGGACLRKALCSRSRRAGRFVKDDLNGVSRWL